MIPNEYTKLLSDKDKDKGKLKIPSIHEPYLTNDNYKNYPNNSFILTIQRNDLDEDNYDNRSSTGHAALTLEQLLVYVDDPWWQKVRFILFYGFWLCLLVILFFACLIIYSHIKSDHCISTSIFKEFTPLLTTQIPRI